MSELSGKKIILAVSGSIAAYKSLFLCRLLVKQGAEVRVIMTPSASEFVSPLSFATLSKHQVYNDLIDGDQWSNHVELGLWADVLLVAPATAHTLAACASGLCQNMLQAVYLSAKCPVIFIPAMDRDMWLHGSTQRNLSTLKSFGDTIIEVNSGELASGLIGPGRMAEPEEIIEHLIQLFSKRQSLKGKNALVNAGPTYEAIDPVRFIGNRSTGKMGVAIARELKARGANVHLVLGPSKLNTADLNTKNVESAEEMFQVCVDLFPKVDLAVLTAAVADYTPEIKAKQKIKKSKNSNEGLQLKLKRTEDIAKTLGEMKTKQVLVGFALETENGEENAKSKLTRKKLDAIVLNSLGDKGAGFAYDTNKVKIMSLRAPMKEGELKSKADVAIDIVDYLEAHFLS